MEEKLLRVKEILQKYHQEQLLDNYERISPDKKNKLLDEILTVDFNQIEKLYQKTKEVINFKEAKIEPIEYIEKEKMTEEERKHYEEIGSKIIQEGKYAVVTMAGGQRNKTRA